MGKSGGVKKVSFFLNVIVSIPLKTGLIFSICKVMDFLQCGKAHIWHVANKSCAVFSGHDGGAQRSKYFNIWNMVRCTITMLCDEKQPISHIHISFLPSYKFIVLMQCYQELFTCKCNKIALLKAVLFIIIFKATSGATRPSVLENRHTQMPLAFSRQ